MRESNLTVGETGYIFDHGKHHPARVICTDLIQTFGPIDEIVAYQPWLPNPHELTVRLVKGSCPVSGNRWVSTERYNEIERASIAQEAGRLQSRLARIST